MWAPDEDLANETRYVTHSAGAFFPETIHASLVDPITSITLQLKIEGEDLFETPVTVQNADRFDRTHFASGWRDRTVIDRRRIEAVVTVNSGYSGTPPKGLRLAIGGRRITT